MAIDLQAQARLVFEGPLPDGYELRAPVAVEVWREGGEVVADAPDLDLHAFGTDVDAALAALGVRIVDHLTRLEELGDGLAPRMLRERDRLRALVALPGA